ncbi:MAG TPA: SCP2 sterol-binding domain-containing protein [Phenylobacterium sp.]|jgi:putative sterol carrier protein|nr:SCP2 sterol-binding domain-containing protein [Phenylobacterium sp.]
MATLEELTDRIRRAAASDADPGQDMLGKSVKLDLKGEGVIHLEGRAVSNEDKPADLTVTLAKRDLEALGRGELDPVRAMMSGRMKLSDMGLALKLQPKIQALFEKAGR